jgi:DNA-binding NtrC family response regulator
MTNILVIDDDPGICEIFQTLLEGAGYAVRTSTSSKNLPELLEVPPDIVLLDVMMPDANGLECLPQIKSLCPGTEVVIVTGVNDYGIADLFYEAGAHSFLTKPIRPKDLLSPLQRIQDTPAQRQAPEIDF